jgi:hypothetical protein
MRRTLIFVWAFGIAAGADYDPVEVLKRVAQNARASADHAPNYTCVETVTRDYYRPAAATLPRACDVLMEQRQHPTLDLVLGLFATDRLRLDVTMASRGEIFSWAGASRFEDSRIDHLVHYGPFGSGHFTGFLIAVFETDVKRFTFDRALTVDGRTLMEYSFRVAKANSSYKVKVHNSWAPVPYSGIVRVDPETAGVVWLTITDDDLPAGVGACPTTTALDYALAQIGEERFLLPRLGRQRYIYPDAEEVQNTTELSNCREFRGESTVTFFEGPGPVASDTGRAVPVLAASIPAGQRFSLALTTPIQTGTAAAGDPFSATLIEPIRDAKRRVLAPKGATVGGRLLRVQNFYRPPEVVVVLRPDRLWVRDGRVALTAVRDWTLQVAEMRKSGKKKIEIALPLKDESNSGVFRFSGQHVTIPSGFRSDWKTTSPGPPAAPR